MNDTAMITAVHRDRYELCYHDETIYGRLKKADFYNSEEAVSFPTVGDRVEIMYHTDGDSLILKVLERKSVFMRLNATQGMPDQAVAANFSHVFITMSLNQDFHPSKLERYLAVSRQSGGIPVILLTKADLTRDREAVLEQIAALAPDVDVYCVSSYTGEGFLALENYFTDGNIIVLLGSSGVGKSSFINLLMGETQMKTGEIREADAQGRHTTTVRQMMSVPDKILLPDGRIISGGGRIIDTPGMRKLIMGEGTEGIEEAFDDIGELAARCRFADCKHQAEPGCAVKRALEDGSLAMRHWKTYLDLCREEAFAEKRAQILARRSEKIRKSEKMRKRRQTRL